MSGAPHKSRTGPQGGLGYTPLRKDRKVAKLKRGQSAQILCETCSEEEPEVFKHAGLKVNMFLDDDGDPSVVLQCLKHDIVIATLFVHPESYGSIMDSPEVKGGPSDDDDPLAVNAQRPPEVM